jgi:demethoxyubiquinone hydroxylase (CLK1/Coq7/Cat5 family)
MWDQEKKHLNVMNKLQLQHHVRPTVLWEVAQVAGYGLGVATALMGKEAAMACTEAVETVIGEHYEEYGLSSRTPAVHDPDRLSAANSKPWRISPITQVYLC